MRGHGLHVDRVLHVGVFVAEHVAELRRVVPVGQRGVQRVGAEHHVRLPGLEQVVGADAEPFRELLVGGRPAERVGQLLGRLAQLEQQLLRGAPDVDLPPLVAEVPLDLAADAGRRVRGQAVPNAGS